MKHSHMDTARSFRAGRRLTFAICILLMAAPAGWAVAAKQLPACASSYSGAVFAVFHPSVPIKGVPDPIAHWQLDDESDEVLDSAGNHHGTIHGAVQHAGRFGKARLFDRPKGDHISIPHSPDFEIGTFTVSAWVWLTKEPTFSGILGTRSGGEFNFDMKVNADKVHGDIGDGTRWIDTAINFYKDDIGSNGQGGDLETSRWYMVTFVVDNELKECRLYLDADRKKTIPFKGEPRLMRPGQTMTIGNTGAGEFMDGVIDDVRIWKHALTDEQVQKLATH